MKRLTKKSNDNNHYVLNHKEDFTEDSYQVIQKLGETEESEEELCNNFSGKNEDCSFKVLFEATKNGFWYKVKYLNKYIHLVPDENHTIVYSWNDGYPILQYMEVTNDIYYTAQCVYDVFFTDYKKTFWLKEDRSE